MQKKRAKKAHGAAPEPTAVYLVADSLNHDGELYAPDDEIELDEDAAAPLLATGVIVHKPAA